MGKVALSAAMIFSVLALALYLWRIEPFLPERGGATCFAADYSPPRTIDLSSPRRDKKSTAEVKSARLKISLSPSEEPFRDGNGRSYDWRYSLQLEARLTNEELLSSAAICDWSDGGISRIMPALLCYIDCDGGSVSVFRKIGQNSLSAWFEPGERLRTGQTCDGGGGIFIGAETEWRRLPVEAAKCTE
ncbi:MAG: hypothetical protein GY844_23645 [Bradyrhizobium sp.]|nr:hypothetical protein [Bradyrhizobium sp.]